ncbi:MAG TPA: DUF3810 domain-containing protein [Lachnoclostridium sp.]|jgi:hypothetical protein|uniref:DUF3810 domain-containing protein n=1 Tax=Lacrimispora sp. TaxID=2719234 RepID=UPI000ED3C7B3|nr:DUF3810 domain-containing protein [Lacrimispora sp.]HCD43201.1 DUF3810 domain-containing protein [Lachnoclostridium sp.]
MGGRSRNQDKRLIAASALMFAISLLLQILARKVPGFGDWYARRVYRFMVGSIGRLSGGFPFALVETGTCLLILYVVYYVFIHRKEGKKILIRAVFLVTGLFLLFTVDCGINYYRKPFSSYSGLEVRLSSLEELKSLCLQLTDEVNRICREGLAEETDLKSLEKESVKAMKRLGEVYPELAGYYPPPKPLLWSYFFSVQQLCGQYSPFTVEATYNRSMPDYNIPHTVCHELSHLRGFMREDEANFIGYLACIGSDDNAFRYSGNLTGWIYATNALAKADREAYAEVCGLLSEKAWADLRYNNEFWGKYEGKTAEVSNRMNDTYLKLNNQSDGVASYGRMVDLMLAYARSK